MYAVAKEHRSTKLLTKVRRAPAILDNSNTNNSIDNSIIKKDSQIIELNDICNKQNSPTILTSPKSIHHHYHHHTKQQQQQDEEISVQHQAMIRYINDSWRRIQQELEHSSNSSNRQQTIPSTSAISNNKNSQNPKNNTSMVKIKHINGHSSTQIPKNFVPFDLESFFGQRFIQKLLQSS